MKAQEHASANGGLSKDVKRSVEVGGGGSHRAGGAELLRTAADCVRIGFSAMLNGNEQRRAKRPDITSALFARAGADPCTPSSCHTSNLGLKKVLVMLQRVVEAESFVSHARVRWCCRSPVRHAVGGHTALTPQRTRGLARRRISAPCPPSRPPEPAAHLREPWASRPASAGAAPSQCRSGCRVRIAGRGGRAARWRWGAS